MARDTFSQRTTENIAKRAGYNCSICCQSTIGPSEQNHQGHNYIGVDAHITAASPGGLDLIHV